MKAPHTDHERIADHDRTVQELMWDGAEVRLPTSSERWDVVLTVRTYSVDGGTPGPGRIEDVRFVRHEDQQSTKGREE